MISIVPYTLEIVSLHSDTKNKSLKQHSLRGELCVGALMNEPFEIVFTNNSFLRAAVKLSLDGTDLMTGELATSEYTHGKMWMVEPYGKLSLKAWPETDGGGAALVFTGLNQSVAVHTHGDISSRGIIAAAVFVESYVAPPIQYIPYSVPSSQPVIPLYPSPWSREYPYWWQTKIGDVLSQEPNTAGYPQSGITWTITSGDCQLPNNPIGGGGSWSVSSSDISGGQCCGSIQSDIFSLVNEVGSLSNNAAPQSLAAVGAGQYTEQKISYTAGLTTPKFETTLKLRYDWWENLQEQLRANAPSNTADGFPGDAKRRMSLGTTPRIGETTRKLAPPVEYQRI